MEKQFYEYINISNVINKLKLKKTNQIANNIYVICPYCQSEKENNGYMKANMINNLFICNKCQKTGTSVSLYADMKYITTKEAYKQLLKETPILDTIPYIYHNPLKDEYYRDMVYRKFLDLLILKENHYNYLKSSNFTDEFIKEYSFKSVNTNNNLKKDICRKLIEEGYKLDGIPGFYQDNDFKWTYKSHDGIFIPVILDDKIQGLRILLDKEYNLGTKNIWFSSSNEYNGTKANNWPLVLKDKSINWYDMYNSKKTTSIIIATEIFLAYKLFHLTGKTIIGVPNNIDKDIILYLVNRIKADKVVVFADTYSLKCTSNLFYKNIVESLKGQGIDVDFKLAIGKDFLEEEIDNLTEENIKIA